MNEKVSFDSFLKDSIENINSVTNFVTIEIFNTKINVRQYLPVNEKLKLISKIVSALSENNFVNPVQLDVYATVEIVKAYTNIEFAEDTEVWNIYDALEHNNFINKIISAIPETEYKFLQDGIEESVSAYYAYRNSVLGILETISQDYSNLNLEASEIQQKIADPNNLTLLKDVITKLG